MVSRLEQATHIGGCGFCNGLGTMLRCGMEKKRPSKPGYGSADIIFAVSRTVSIHISRLSLGSTPNPSSSRRELASPVPQSTRPSLTKSSVAILSATRAGWLNPGGMRTIPCPRRILFVRWLHAARNTSGAEEWEYSSRKWCFDLPGVVNAEPVS